MPVTAKQKNSHIRVKQFVTDRAGHKMSVVIDMEEFSRLESILNLIPGSEAWLYKNKKALESVERGLNQAAQGKIKKLAISEL